MPSFSQRSMDVLITCHSDLQLVMREVIRHVDIILLSGYRSREEQQRLFDSGTSKNPGGASKHNNYPSDAIDFAPYPIDWEDLHSFSHVAGIIRGIGMSFRIKLRWGGDWNGNGRVKDERFRDFGHLERKS